MARHAGGAQRVTRAAGLSVLMVALAAGAHATAGGATPGIPTLVALSLVATVPVLALAGRRRGVLLTAALLGAGQWVMHQAFVLLAVPACTTAAVAGAGSAAAGAHVGHAGHAGHGAVETMAAMCAGASHAHAHGEHADSLTMVLLHVVATGLTAAVVASGERAAARVGAWLTRLVRVPAAATSAPRSPVRLLPVGWSLTRPAVVLGRRCTPLRGPPVVA